MAIAGDRPGRMAPLRRDSSPEGEPASMIEPKIDDLQARVDSRYTLVILAAKRAREINSYYSQLGEGRGEYVPPLVETGDLRSKPLAIALQEIADGKVSFERLEASSRALVQNSVRFSCTGTARRSDGDRHRGRRRGRHRC